ncbi:MAG: hypothetical protein NXI09_15675 [Bacteroidetes bacterium]|nr:hypothetical protein [Bacteroidota bacterium]
MIILLVVLTILTLTLIFWQDLQFRAVSWPLFPLTLCLLLIYRNQALPWNSIISSWSYNLGFLAVNVLLLFLIFKLKGVSPLGLLQHKMGIGDFLFFFVLALILPFPAFPFFYILTTLIALLSGLIVFRRTTVPLAGLQALCLAILLLINEGGIINIDKSFQWIR